MAGNFFRGTSTDQVMCKNAEQKLVKKLSKEGRFPDHFSQKVDMSKVSMDVMRPWITRRITELMGFEDDIVVDYCIVQLTEAGEKGVDPKMLQVHLTGFMERKAAPFCSELWKCLLSAQQSVVGVPQEFIDDKKDELRQKREEAQRVQEEISRRKRDLQLISSGQREDRSRSRSGTRAARAAGAASEGGRNPRGPRPAVALDDASGSSPEPQPRRRRRFE